MDNRTDCVGCFNKQTLTDYQIEALINEQLLLEFDIVTQKLLQERLDICGNCTRLFNYTCMSCGCFAKFRASLSSKNCPEGKW